MPIKKIALLLVIALIVAVYIIFDGEKYLSLAFFQDLYEQQPLLTAAVYFIIYVVSVSVSLPGAALLTIIGGMIFGLWTGLLLVSFASSVGATLAFLVSRFLLRDWVQNKFSNYLGSVNRGYRKRRCVLSVFLTINPCSAFLGD